MLCVILLLFFAGHGESSVGIPLDLTEGDDVTTPFAQLAKPLDERGLRNLAEFLERKLLKIAITSGFRQLESLEALDQLVERSSSGSSSPATELCETFFGRVSEEGRELAKTAILLSGAVGKLFGFGSGISLDDAVFLVRGSVELKQCPKMSENIRCLGTRYRSLNGACNNVENAWWGASWNPLGRLLPPDYTDGVQEPLFLGRNGDELPSPRDVSRFIHTYRAGTSRPTQKQLSLLFPSWAHFVHTDLVELASWRGSNGQCLDCCKHGYHSECMNIPVSSADLAFSYQKCLAYTRLLPGVLEECRLIPRTPANLATSYLDGGAIYGSTSSFSESIREFEGGRLLTQKIEPDWAEIPLSEDDSSRCRSEVGELPCFKYGAHGNNFLPIPMALLWIREHNRLAEELSILNPHWNDERLFEEARRIVAASIQYITFSEYLPMLVGKGVMSNFGLNVKVVGFYGGYSRETNAQISVAFATAAGLFYHSMWPDEITSKAARESSQAFSDLSDSLFRPKLLYVSGFIEGIIRSAAETNPSIRSEHLSRELTERFLTDPFTFSANDLAAIIIQMGRDAGLRKYPEWRWACGLSEVLSFNDLVTVGMESETVDLLRAVYSSVEDLDLFTGGSLEPNAPGAVVGETFACILASQFQALRKGDRFWHENYFYPSAFTESQLEAIRSSSLSRIICDNTNIERIQPKAMEAQNDFENCPVFCNGTVIERPDLSVFRDAEEVLSLPISEETLNLAIEYGTRIAEERRTKESTVGLTDRSASAFLHFLSLSPAGYAVRVSNMAEVLLEATRLMLGKSEAFNLQLPQNLDQNILQTILPTMDVRHILPELPDSQCLKRTWPCDHSAVFRSITGWCNNLKFAEYGSIFGPFRRLVEPTYDDGFNSPRTLSMLGRPLPGARLVSLKVHHIPSTDQPIYSHFTMQWGQFLDHDIALAALTPAQDGKPLDCRDCDSAETVSVNCFPIPIPPEDPFFDPYTPNRRPKCFGFPRSLLGQLTLGYRQQMTEVTPFLDASNVYGSDDCKAADLREFRNGLLKSKRIFGSQEMLPENEEDEECRSTQNKCFFAGDVRVNEHHGLTCIHTIWMREHNRLARGLAKVNPQWNDERLYQEARRIVIALHQRISYAEFLPKIIGLKTMDKYDLLPMNQGYYRGYDYQCDPRVSNVFATAAYRFGHSLIQSEFETRDANDQTVGVIELQKTFFNPDSFYQQRGYCGPVVKGMCGQASGDVDRAFTDTILNRLFEEEGKPKSGLDLPALNIQRGRDHGLGTYTQYRKRFGLSVPSTFRNLYGIMDNDTVAAMKSVYDHVSDIDVFPGLMSEIKLRGALVGPTAAEIIGEQFSRLRKCDRFWHENPDQPGSFTTAQLGELRKSTLAKVLCQHTPEMNHIQEQVFNMPDSYQNNVLDCDKIPDMDLSHWRDQGSCLVGSVTIARGQSKGISPCISCTCTSEGPRCHSFRVRNCMDLLSQFNRRDVMADDACVVQCFAFVDLSK